MCSLFPNETFDIFYLTSVQLSGHKTSPLTSPYADYILFGIVDPIRVTLKIEYRYSRCREGWGWGKEEVVVGVWRTWKLYCGIWRDFVPNFRSSVCSLVSKKLLLLISYFFLQICITLYVDNSLNQKKYGSSFQTVEIIQMERNREQLHHFRWL